jgi:hypothetical protein
MFSRAHRPVTTPATRNAFIVALASTLLVWVAAGQGLAAPQTVSRDPQALTLTASSLKALTGGTRITDVTLTGTVTRTAGSDVETGAVTLLALGGLAGRMNMTLTDGPRGEVINQLQGQLAGEWSGPDGVEHAMAQHNALVPAAWFFPALALAEVLNDLSVQVAYVDQETMGGVAVAHVQFWRVLPSGFGSAASALFQHLTTADVYLAAANSLPVALVFNIHPDDNEGLDIPLEIQYGGYQTVNGILLPARVQKFINNSLFLDLSITGVAVNTNLPPSDFAVTAANQ